MRKPRRIKEFVEVSDYCSLDVLITRLTEIRDNLPDNHEAELSLRGNDFFGHKLTITYFREQTKQEIKRDKKYTHESKSRKVG